MRVWEDFIKYFLIAVLVISALYTGIYLTGKASYDHAEQNHKHHMSCLDRGGEWKYITNIGTRCVIDD